LLRASRKSYCTAAVLTRKNLAVDAQTSSNKRLGMLR
jgi:hypothetical protein